VPVFNPILGSVFRIALSFLGGLFDDDSPIADELYSKIMKEVRLMVAKSVQNSRLKEVHQTIKGVANQFTVDVQQLVNPHECTGDLVKAHKDLSASLGKLKYSVLDETCLQDFTNGSPMDYHWSPACIEWEKAGSVLVAVYWAHLPLQAKVALAHVTAFCPQFTDRNAAVILDQVATDAFQYLVMLDHSLTTLKDHRLSSDTLKPPYLSNEHKSTHLDGFAWKYDSFTWTNNGCTDSFPSGVDDWICSGTASQDHCRGPRQGWGKGEDHSCRSWVERVQNMDFQAYKNDTAAQLNVPEQQIQLLFKFLHHGVRSQILLADIQI